MIKLDPYMSHSDERGLFTGITRQPWAEINFVETAAGQIRGDHYHRETKELFFIVSGEIHIRIRDVRTGVEKDFTASAGDIFVVEPYENHVFETRTKAAWINMLSKPLDERSPDFHRIDQGEKE